MTDYRKVGTSPKNLEAIRQLSEDPGKYLDDALERNRRSVRKERQHFGYTDNRKKQDK